MLIERNLSKFIVFSEDSLINALGKISDNKNGVVFSVSESGQIEGILTDGDFRRWITSTVNIDLNIPVKTVCNKQFLSLPLDTPHEEIEAAFNDRISVIPLVDKHLHLVSIALRKPAEFKIGEFIIGDNNPAFIIAEIGNNHNGSLELAKKLIGEAAKAGANCAKFQLRSMGNLYKNSGTSDASEDLGAQYTLDLLSRFQLNNEDMFAAFDYCKEIGIMPLCTPWDHESLKLLDEYGMQGFKLASADLTNHDLLEAMARTGKPIIASTGMSSEAEIIEAVSLLRRFNARFILLHCNSTYPAPFKDVNLNYLDRLKKIGSCPIGYSGHERGIAVAIAAVANGAKVIEKHFTLDRNMEGNDHRVSLLPTEFKDMVEGIREVEQALGSNDPRRISQGEMMNREVLAKSLVINCDLQTGQKINADMVEIRSPGKGLSPYRKADLIGKIARHDFKSGDFFYPSDIDAEQTKPRHYKFSRPFGIPVRYHDVATLGNKSNFDLLEFHLSYKDLEEDLEKFFSTPLDMDFVVHSPELFAGDHIIDLCSPDEAYRKHSILELQRVIDVTHRLKPFFKRAKKPMIVLNAGGFSMDGFIAENERDKLHDLIAESLSQVNLEEVEIIPQSMPPFPWHFGGQRYHNLFMLPDDIERFCTKYNYRICLDISHSQLTCNHFGLSFCDFLEQIGKFTSHCHIVDAEGIDAEGLQIGDGMVDFGMVAEVMARRAPNASFIPEIWQGHKNNGEGFWQALEKLEKWF